MIQRFLNDINEVRRILSEQNIGFRHFFLDDAAVNLPDEYPILVRHQKNKGLDQILLKGYQAIFSLKSKTDLIIRIDCQEHDPLKIPFILDHFLHSSTKVIFLPVCYWIEGNNRPLMKEITKIMLEFNSALSPIDRKIILAIYNQKFPMGYQAFTTDALAIILPQLKKGVAIFKEKFKEQPRWGLDLLVMLVAANQYPKSVDFVFGGWSKPWLENRGREKIEAQRKQAAKIIEVAVELGCKTI